MPDDLYEILVSVGKEVERINDDFGATPRSMRERAMLAIDYLQGKICPHRDEIMRRSRSREGELSALLIDLIGFWLGNTIPGTGTLTKAIAEIGLEAFCKDPHGSLGARAHVDA